MSHITNDQCAFLLPCGFVVPVVGGEGAGINAVEREFLQRHRVVHLDDYFHGHLDPPRG